MQTSIIQIRKVVNKIVDNFFILNFDLDTSYFSKKSSAQQLNGKTRWFSFGKNNLVLPQRTQLTYIIKSYYI